MGIKLQTIQFNHSPGSANHDALNIRRNRTQEVPNPEWTKGVSVLSSDSVAAYSMQQTTGQTITIKVRLTSDTFKRAEIRAVNALVDPDEPRGCLAWLIWMLLLVFRGYAGTVLGDAKARWVSFTNGDSGIMDFELENHKFNQRGVGIYYTKWEWQYRQNRLQAWKNFDKSSHKIYVVLEEPKEPWNQVPGSDLLPWTEALEYACTWARFRKTRDAAAARITESVYDLGPSIIEYDCPGSGSSHYVYAGFNCSKFIERLNGLNGNGKYVNCTDCAAIVTTFSNLLGCELWSSQMRYSFSLNPLLAIGSSVWQTACNWSGFSYHEVAWKNNCDVNDEIFDACLQVDGDGDPTLPPHSALLPVNMIFGDCNTMNYRLRLTPQGASGCDACTPRPSLKRRYTVY